MRDWFNKIYYIFLFILWIVIPLSISIAEEKLSLPVDPIVGPRDILEIQVFNEPTMSMNVVVSASSQFSFPLLRRVDATNMTLDELGQHMEKRLLEGRYLIDPSVTVRFVEQNFFVVTLSGNVISPGVVPIYPGIRLRELFAQRGGINNQLAGPYIHIHGDSSREFKIPRKQLENGAPDEMREYNIELMPKDEIIVPSADEFFVLGAVNKPGSYKLTRKTTIGEALGMAGGRTENGGNTLFWHSHLANGDPVITTFTYSQYQQNEEIRASIINESDSIYIAQADFVFVGGKVNKPGMYPWKPKMTLQSAIIAAEGRHFTASRTIILIREDSNGKQEKTSYHLSDLKKQDVQVYPGDIIYSTANALINIPYTIKQINPFSFPLRMLDTGLLE